MKFIYFVQKTFRARSFFIFIYVGDIVHNLFFLLDDGMISCLVYSVNSS